MENVKCEVKMKIKHLPRTTEFIYLEEVLQYMRIGTANTATLFCFGSVVLSVLAFSCSRSCSLSLRSTVSVNQCSVGKHGSLSVVTDFQLGLIVQNLEFLTEALSSS